MNTRCDGVAVRGANTETGCRVEGIKGELQRLDHLGMAGLIGADERLFEITDTNLVEIERVVATDFERGDVKNILRNRGDDGFERGRQPS